MRGHSAGVLARLDEDYFVTTDVAGLQHVLVGLDVPDQRGAVRPEAGKGGVEVVDDERDVPQAEGVDRAVGAAVDRVRRLELAELDPVPVVRGAQHRDVAAGAVESDDAVDELALHVRLALQLHAERLEERDGGREVGDGDADVVHALDGHVLGTEPRSGPRHPKWSNFVNGFWLCFLDRFGGRVVRMSLAFLITTLIAVATP